MWNGQFRMHSIYSIVHYIVVCSGGSRTGVPVAPPPPPPPKKKIKMFFFFFFFLLNTKIFFFILKKKKKTHPVFFLCGGGGGGGRPARRSWIRLCSISLTCIIFLSLFIYSSVTVLISSSLLFEPSMTSGMSEASSNYVFQCLTPLTDSWGPPYDKYHITQLSLAIQAINYPINVFNPAFVLLARENR